MKLYSCLVIFALFSPISSLASDTTKQDGKALIEEAENKADIFALPAFALKANVRMETLGKMVEGLYEFYWNGPDKWREEINFPGYVETQVGGKGVVFLKRTTDFLPLRIYQLHSALGYGTGGLPSTFFRLVPLPNETIKKTHDRSGKGFRLSCVEIEKVGGYKYTREVCVDKSSGTVIREGFLDKDWMPIGAKSFPRFLSYVEKGKPLVEIQITELNTTEPGPPSTFEPPQGAISRPGCMNPTPPDILKQTRPTYPYRDRASHTVGKVSIYAVIGSDGIPQRLQIVAGATADMNSESLDTVRQWRYSPPTCDDHAAEIETIISVNYEM